MGKVLALANPDLANGFRLAGLDTRTVRSAEETYQALLKAAASHSHEIVILPQEHFLELDERRRREIEHFTEQVVVPIPMTNLQSQPSPRPFVSEMVRRAVGFTVKV